MLQHLPDMLLCGFVICFVILWVWLLAITLAGDWIYQIHCRFFRLSREQFDLIHYCGMGLFKMVAFLLFLVPWLATLIVI
ncbi:DUF6868 family protein [Dongshaea marina]|uniref:DUF6868 family protein n=1 Tax=Dongshaea marina TaxID=2047966 RepID=UPI000D3EA14A|nr:hypothetical protein [Dongshaea marina]